ncbi:hypothetical protein ACIHEJ_39100 [Streptomyces sp. NPDC052301]|uniref:hypothetical protein n=1 Tax=Streptomyces sp. NPDC052301 TaxID=3365687 RepID=UPI0037D0988C
MLDTDVAAVVGADDDAERFAPAIPAGEVGGQDGPAQIGGVRTGGCSAEVFADPHVAEPFVHQDLPPHASGHVVA